MKHTTIPEKILTTLVSLFLIQLTHSSPPITDGYVEIIHTFENLPPLYASPEGITFDKKGKLYVSLRTYDGASFIKNGLVSISSTGKTTVITDLGPALSRFPGALGLTTDTMGNVYIAFASGNELHGVWKVSPDGKKEHLKGSENIETPNGISFDPEGNLYVTDSSFGVQTPEDPGRVWRYGANGVFEIWAWSPLLAPDPIADPLSPPPPAPPLPGPGANGIVYAPENKLYVANTEKCLILEIPILSDGSAGETKVVAGAYPPQGPPGMLFAPDGLAIDAKGHLYTVVPPSGFTGPEFPLSPLIKIDPQTGDLTAVLESLVAPSRFFDFPTSLTFGVGNWDNQSVYVTGVTAKAFSTEGGSGPRVTRVKIEAEGYGGLD